MEDPFSLILEDCKKLVCLPDSLAKCKMLESLNLHGCSKLQSFPDLTGLERLISCSTNEDQEGGTSHAARAWYKGKYKAYGSAPPDDTSVRGCNLQ